MKVEVPISGKMVVLTEDNCRVYKFRDLPEIDHIYVELSDRQFYIFGSPELIESLIAAGATYVVTQDGQPPACDEEAFVTYTMQGLDADLDAL